MPFARWYIQDWQEYAKPFTYVIILTTDAPCHLWMRWTHQSPFVHPRTGIFRGLATTTSYYYCFTSYNEIEQAEAGDTLTHTFTATPWAACETRWFYFHGEIDGTPAASTSPIWGRHLYTETANLFTRVLAPSDDGSYYGEHFWSCPGNCPSILPVGRWQVQANKCGSSMRFTNITIPRYSVIDACVLWFTAIESEAGNWVKCRLSCEKVDDAPDFSLDDEASWIARLANRTGSTDWDNLPAWTKDHIYVSPDVSPRLQAIVNRPGFTPGNAVVFFWEDWAQRSTWWPWRGRWAYPYHVDPTKSAQLSVKYTAWLFEAVASCQVKL